MLRADQASDSQLLEAARAGQGEAFGSFYARHERRLLTYLVRRTRSGEIAADLCAEVFAAALSACRGAATLPDVPVAWLFAIANHKLADSARRARVEDRARCALQMQAIELTRGQVSDIERLCADSEADSLLAGLAEEQRSAVLAHVVDERGYPEIAAGLSCSESVVRKRVSRGLAQLRLGIEEGR
jgi:RNA polymerase sigma factor (sigma-70 family)